MKVSEGIPTATLLKRMGFNNEIVFVRLRVY